MIEEALAAMFETADSCDETLVKPFDTDTSEFVTDTSEFVMITSASESDETWLETDDDSPGVICA